MINDLLREHIPVYWAATDFTADTKEINDEGVIRTDTHPKGTFVIPFSSDTNITALTTAIIHDYNTTSEIEQENTIHVPVYYLVNPLTISAYPLTEPKIVQHLGVPTRYSWPCYLQIAEAGGFLTMEFLLDNETSVQLNNNDFNVFMWPYDPLPGSILEQLKSLSNTQANNAIRMFVRNGGGYIGSCYGAIAGSSGLLFPTPFISLLRAYNPNLPCFPPCISLSISDSFMNQKKIIETSLFVATTTITDTNHPLSYGLNHTMKEFFEGPWFIWLGKNSQQIATIQNLENGSESDPNSILLRNKVLNTPSWVTSRFGMGNVVLFSTHPEFTNNISLIFDNIHWDGDPYYGRRIIYNALFYATSQEGAQIITSMGFPISSLDAFGEKTMNVHFSDSWEHVLNETKTRIQRLNTNLSILQNNTEEVSTITSDYINMSFIILNGHRLSAYPYYFCDIYSEYCEKAIGIIEKLEQFHPLVNYSNNSTNQQIQNLTAELSDRLQHMEDLMTNVNIIEQRIIDAFQKPAVSHIQEPFVAFELRRLCSTFEIGLKYVPQIYFEALKLLRHLWYTYEASLAMQ
ncbi:MAG: hypothetical protein NT038_03435 [Euryarchaeota archaeon]|nr:hypothetical protein [Euryarchaeota archaeon]